MILTQLSLGSSFTADWDKNHIHSCFFFSFFKAVKIMKSYCLSGLMKWAGNSDSETHVKRLNPTSRTEIKRKPRKYLFLETPCITSLLANSETQSRIENNSSTISISEDPPTNQTAFRENQDLCQTALPIFFIISKCLNKPLQ